MDQPEPFSTHLRSQGYRLTPQRLTILRILRESGGHLTPGEIYAQAHPPLPGLTEATVYRTLGFLVEQGLVMVAHVGNGQFVYEIAEHNHHHLICRACGNTQEIDHADLQVLYDRLQADTGFHIDSLHVTFFGLCPGCQKQSD